MTALSEFFFNSQASVVYLELLEIKHPNFAADYRLVRNAAPQVFVTHENALSFTYEFCPMTIKPLGSGTDLDQMIEINLGDVGQVIATELTNVMAANGMLVKPTAKYRVYRSDDLSAPLYGPISLRLDGVSMNKEGVKFQAKAASYNIVQTGEKYITERFPMLESV